MSKTMQNVVGVVGMILAFFAGTAIMKWYQSTTPAAKEALAMESQFRPAFNLPDLEGKMRNVSDWDGKVVVVNFWATWCPPCRREMPDFIELQEKYGAQGLQFVGIALDDVTKVQDFVDTMGVDYPILVGGDDAMQAAIAYGNSFGALPYTAVINREGKIVTTYRGEVERDQAEELIQTLL